MNKRSMMILLSLMLAASLFLVACAPTEEEPEEQEAEGSEPIEESEQIVEAEPHLLIYTTLFPLYDFAQKIAGDHAEVVSLIPAGAEPHDYEPTISDIESLHAADIFVYNGGGFEHWIEDIVEAVENPHLFLVDSTEHIELLSNKETGYDHGRDDDDHGHNDDDHGRDDDDHGHDDDDHGREDDDRGHDDHGHHDHDHGEFDPHVWIDPTLAKQQAEAIKNALVEVDPDNAADYEANYATLAAQLDELHAEFEHMTEHIERRDFVVSHEAFGHLAHRYDLNQVAITGLSPSQEPSGSRLQEIIEFVRDNDIEYILFENLVTPRVVEVVQAEVGAESLVLHNLEGATKEELAQGVDYFSLMRQNLEVLKLALGYHE